ncbi:MAG: tetratricopeptide repeat protein [Planctomycetota bacterium]
MTPKTFAVRLLALVAAVSPAFAQSDKVHLANGTVVDDVRVTKFGISSIEYKKGSSTESAMSDQVVKVELGKFDDTYARGLRDPGLMLTLAREQKKSKNDVMAQLGFVHAARGFFDNGQDAEAVAALNELEKAYPEGGAVPDVYRLKFEFYMSLGPKKGGASAITVAKKFESTAVSNAWPNGFATEAVFLRALAEQTDAAAYQKKLRDVISRARGSSPVVHSRASVELGHSLRKADKASEAKRLYEDVAKRDNVDENALAGAYLGLGHLALAEAGADKEKAKQALLSFLRVRLETENSWPGLQAEALYQSMQAAAKWQGPEYRTVIGRCRGTLLADFPNSEWAELLRQR